MFYEEGNALNTFIKLKDTHIMFPMGDLGPTCSTALSNTIIKTPNEGISLGGMVFIPPGEFRDLENQCQGALNTLLKTLYGGFSFNLSPICRWYFNVNHYLNHNPHKHCCSFVTSVTFFSFPSFKRINLLEIPFSPQESVCTQICEKLCSHKSSSEVRFTKFESRNMR